mgnify:CR=1 FL=1|jgi:hypothetical protein
MRHTKVAVTEYDEHVEGEINTPEDVLPKFASGKFNEGYYKIKGYIRYVGKCQSCDQWSTWHLRKERPLVGLCKSCAAREAALERWKIKDYPS